MLPSGILLEAFDWRKRVWTAEHHGLVSEVLIDI